MPTDDEGTPVHRAHRKRKGCLAASAKPWATPSRAREGNNQLSGVPAARPAAKIAGPVVLSFTGFDPLRKSSGPKCWDAQLSISYNGVVGCNPLAERST